MGDIFQFHYKICFLYIYIYTPIYIYLIQLEANLLSYETMIAMIVYQNVTQIKYVADD